MPAEVRLRPMTAADLPAVAAIEAAGHPTPRSLQAFADDLALAHARLWVAEAGAELLGFIDYWVVAGEVELIDVAVAPVARRRGLGRRLVEHLRADVPEATAVHLEVRAGNAPAIALYRGLGFTEVGRRRRYYADGEDALLLSWSPPSDGGSSAS
jgi:ribosomal-protein-alanine N-acetyltransferase